MKGVGGTLLAWGFAKGRKRGSLKAPGGRLGVVEVRGNALGSGM
jgi:hypothetical protein